MKNWGTILKSFLTVLALLGSSTATVGENPAEVFTDDYDARFLGTGVGNFAGMVNTQLMSPGITGMTDTDTTNIGTSSITRLSGIQSTPAPPAIWIIAAGFIGLVTVARRAKL